MMTSCTSRVIRLGRSLRTAGRVSLPVVAAGVGFLVGGPPVAAKPLTYGEGVKPIRWPDNKTINIYIETDPNGDPPNVSMLLKEGMDRWAAEMAPRGITINVTVGAIPDPEPDNLVKCQYKAVGTKLDGDEPENPDHPALSDEDLALAGCNGVNEITGAQIIVRDDIWDEAPGQDDDEKAEFIRNLGQHEVTHVLGLADDDDGEVTNHIQDTDPNSYNDEDKKEISTLYPILEPEPDEESKAEGETQQSANPDQYTWQFAYAGPPDGHVALITLDIDPEVVGTLICPAGWVCLNPADPNRLNPNYPYYQGYMRHARSTRWLWDDDVSPPLAIRAGSAAAALSAANPLLTVTVLAVNHQPGMVAAWAGGAPQSLQGPIPTAAPGDVPAVSEWGMIVLLLLLLTSGTIVFGRRRVESPS